MAYKKIEINYNKVVQPPPNQSSQFYKGFSSVDETTSETQLYDFDLIKQDLLNHFNTRKGQRLMNPKFGTIIWDTLMEPLTPEIRQLLTADIREICNLDPRVYPTQIQVNEFERGFLIEIALSMKNTNQTSTLRLMFDQKIGLAVQ